MEKKSACFARISAIDVAEGISIKIPIGISLLYSIPSLSRPRMTPLRILFASRNCPRPDIIGNINLKLPYTLALKIALNWVLNSFRSLRQNRIDLRPKAGLSSLLASISDAIRSLAISRVLIVTGSGATILPIWL